MNKDYVKIFDTTLRDGEQSPGFSMNLSEKIRFASQLEKLGVDVIEAGFPVASPDDFESVRQISKIVESAEVCGLARAMAGDIERCWEAVKNAKKPRIHTFLATSPVHMLHKLRKTPDQILEMSVEAVKLAKSLCERVDFSPEDAGRSDRGFLAEVVAAVIEAGADTINIPDTVGYLLPEEFGNLINFLVKNVSGAENVIFSTHCHDDLGLATANSLAGVLAGARQIECTMNGIGERAGNCALEEVVMALRVREKFFNLKTGIATEEICATSRLLEQITGQKVQANKSIVGKNAFAHESGIHQDGILKKRETYEILTPKSVGRDRHEIVLGKHSGRAALGERLRELGYELDDEKLAEVFPKFKKLADKKKEVFDSDLDVMMMGKKNGEWELVDFEVSSGKSTPRAKISLKNKKTGEIRVAENTGTGMVDAAYLCIEEICGKLGKLTDFSMENVTEGLSSQAVVRVQLETGNRRQLVGMAGDTDIVRASVEAYLDAIAMAREKER